jgi:nucleoside-diphosphate-sugar epimerase
VPAFPENGYGIAKLCAGQMTRIACSQYGMRHVWTRILSIYGPYDGEKTMVMSTIAALLDGRIPDCTKGEQEWDYLYSDDAGRALMLLGQSGHDGKIYCIGSGRTRPLREYIEDIRDAVNPDAQINFGAVDYAPKQVFYLCADISDLHDDTGFEPSTAFADGIKDTINYLKSEKINEKN